MIKYIDKIIIALGDMFLVKKFFFDDSINLGILDKYYGVIGFILFLWVIIIEIYFRIKNKNEN